MVKGNNIADMKKQIKVNSVLQVLIKNSVVKNGSESLWPVVTDLTNSCLKALKVYQGGNRS